MLGGTSHDACSSGPATCPHPTARRIAARRVPTLAEPADFLRILACFHLGTGYSRRRTYSVKDNGLDGHAVPGGHRRQIAVDAVGRPRTDPPVEHSLLLPHPTTSWGWLTISNTPAPRHPLADRFGVFLPYQLHIGRLDRGLPGRCRGRDHCCSSGAPSLPSPELLGESKAIPRVSAQQMGPVESKPLSLSGVFQKRGTTRRPSPGSEPSERERARVVLVGEAQPALSPLRA